MTEHGACMCGAVLPVEALMGHFRSARISRTASYHLSIVAARLRYPDLGFRWDRLDAEVAARNEGSTP